MHGIEQTFGVIGRRRSSSIGGGIMHDERCKIDATDTSFSFVGNKQGNDESNLNISVIAAGKGSENREDG